MLKTLKWVYGLGVKQERQRIASHLQLHATGARNSINALDDMFRDEMNKPKPSKNRLERMDFDRAVNHKIETIIQEMFQGKDHYVSGASIMFPEEEK